MGDTYVYSDKDREEDFPTVTDPTSGDERREKLSEVWTICRRCANEGACNPCEPVEVVPRSPSGLASILQGLDEAQMAERQVCLHDTYGIESRDDAQGLDRGRGGG